MEKTSLGVFSLVRVLDRLTACGVPANFSCWCVLYRLGQGCAVKHQDTQNAYGCGWQQQQQQGRQGC